MISLILDAATDRGIVGIASDGRVIAQKEFAAAFTNSRLLLPIIDELVKSVGKEPSEFAYIACGIGPGSYTGIRVAVAMGKALSFTHHIPLVGFSGLKGFVPLENQEGAFAGVIDARVGGIYCIQGSVTGGVVHFETEERLISCEEFEKVLQTISFLVTLQKKPLLERFPHIQVPIIERAPSLQLLASLAHETFCTTGGAPDGKLSLLYLRKTQAEIERQ